MQLEVAQMQLEVAQMQLEVAQMQLAAVVMDIVELLSKITTTTYTRDARTTKQEEEKPIQFIFYFSMNLK
jgi:hypothetical protein